MKKATLYEPLPDQQVHCQLCAHDFAIPDGRLARVVRMCCTVTDRDYRESQTAGAILRVLNSTKNSTERF